MLLCLGTFILGYAIGKFRSDARKIPVMPGQLWHVPGQGPVRVLGEYQSISWSRWYVALPNVDSDYWPTLKAWHMSGARLIDEDTSDMLNAINEVNRE